MDDFRGFSVNLRGGISISLKYDLGISLGTELCFYKNQNIYSVEYAFQGEFTIFSGEDYTTNQIGFYYGKFWGKNWYRYQLQAGFGPLWGERMVSNRYSSYTTGGVFIKTGIKLLPSWFMGIGADLQLNIKSILINPFRIVFIYLTSQTYYP